MKRLRTRLIVTFLGVAILTMIPLALVSYYMTQVRNEKVRTNLLENALKEIQTDIRYHGSIPASGVLLPLAQYLQQRFSTRPDLQELLELSDSLDDPIVRDQINWWEQQLWKEVPERWRNILWQMNPTLWKEYVESIRNDPFRRKTRPYPIRLIPQKPYMNMQDWLEKGLLYEEDNKLYCYANQPVFKGEHRSEMEIIGGLFLKILLIEKFPNDATKHPVLNSGGKMYDPQPTIMEPLPGLFESYLTRDQLARLFGFSPYTGNQEVNIPQVKIHADDTRWPLQYRQAPQGGETIPMQMILFPIVNHRNELSAVLVLGVPITSVLGTIGYPLLIAYLFTLFVIIIAAHLFARSISKPVNLLVSAAHRMTGGDLDVRVQERGAEELRLLSQSFNRLAERIQTQIGQLHQQTLDLEKSNKDLSQTQQFLENILANVRTGVMSVDAELRITHVNQVGETILQLGDWKQQNIQDAIPCDSFVNLIQYALQQNISIHENEIPYECGETILSLQVSIIPLCESDEVQSLVVTFHDLTALRQLEEDVRRHDRLAALGRMAAGVAHEIRNPLGIIRGSAELLHQRFAGQPGEEGLSEFILDEVKRLSIVVNQFLQFSRPPEPRKEPMTIRHLFAELKEYFGKQELEPAYHLELDMGEAHESLQVNLDMNLCKQAFLNLFINAEHAMPNGGRILLRCVRLSKEIALEIEDEGEGIPPERLDRIFDPFYTSKEKGTGLGLSLVHQIVTCHGGRMEVRSKMGWGSTFRLIFPLYDAGSVQDSPSHEIPATMTSRDS